MDGPLKVLLLAGMALLVSAQFDNYRSLPDNFREHIDKALKKANSNFGGNQHIAFHSIKSAQLGGTTGVNVNVLLKVTRCTKTSKTAYEHRDACVARKVNTPMIDCLVCNTKENEEVVDCARLFEVSKKHHKDNRDKCTRHLIGKSNIMSQKSAKDKQIGCIGCV